jgi:flagellar protein FlaJ
MDKSGLVESEEKKKGDQKIIMVAVSLISTVLIFAGILIGDLAVMGNMIIIAIFITAIPYFFFKYSGYMWIKSLESEFPNFIRDMADALRSMPLPEALGIVSKSKYGNLTPEIRSIYNRMTWGTPFLRALDIFGRKVRNSKIITESITILRESYKSGGNMVSTLESISRDLLMLREADQERSSMLRQHILVMYSIFFMFMGISMLIIFVMVPMIETSSSSSGGFQQQLVFSNPCPSNSALIFPCGFYSMISTTLGISPEKIGAYYISLFFSSLVIQGIFVGLITGQLGENSVLAGIKHSIIMVFISIAIFLFFSKVGVLPM